MTIFRRLGQTGLEDILCRTSVCYSVWTSTWLMWLWTQPITFNCVVCDFMLFPLHLNRHFLIALTFKWLCPSDYLFTCVSGRSAALPGWGTRVSSHTCLDFSQVWDILPINIWGLFNPRLSSTRRGQSCRTDVKHSRSGWGWTFRWNHYLPIAAS